MGVMFRCTREGVRHPSVWDLGIGIVVIDLHVVGPVWFVPEVASAWSRRR